MLVGGDFLLVGQAVVVVIDRQMKEIKRAVATVIMAILKTKYCKKSCIFTLCPVLDLGEVSKLQLLS